MANNKPKKSANKSKKKDTKATVKTEKTEAPEIKAETKRVEKVEKVEEKKVIEATKSEKTGGVKGFCKEFFAKKCDPKENILTAFHDKKLYGALAGEVLGTMFLLMILMTLGAYQPLYIFIVILALTATFYGVSGAHLNPVITAGMMATRRISAIRGVLYILAQVLGAWLGYLIASAFWNAGGQTTMLPQIGEVPSEFFWAVTLIEMIGAAMITFFYTRALQYRRSTLTLAAIVAGGFTLTLIAVVIFSSTFLGLSSSFALNPAAALMYQILPSGGDNIGDLLSGIALALVTYVVFPLIGGVSGAYISDLVSFAKDEKVRMD